MTTQQEQPQPQTEPQDLALRVGRLEGLLEMVIEHQRSQAATIDALRSEVNARIDALRSEVNARLDTLDRKFTMLISGAFHRPPHRHSRLPLPGVTPPRSP